MKIGLYRKNIPRYFNGFSVNWLGKYMIIILSKNYEKYI